MSRGPGPGPSRDEPPRGLWASLGQIGPGIIISGSIVGSGELIVTTRLGAEVGFVLLWLVLFSCFIKVFVQIELGRHSIASSATALEAFDAMPGPRIAFGPARLRLDGGWLVWLWAVMAICSVFQLSGILLALAQLFELESLGIGRVSPQVWFLVAVVATAGLLAWGRYAHVERTSTALVFVFTAVTALAVALVQIDPRTAFGFAEVGQGLALGVPTDGLLTALALLGVTGVGASELVYYPYWCLEKGYARRAGRPDGTPEWTERARGWIRVMKVDAWVSFLVYTSATVAFYLLGAATLHGGELVPDDLHMHEALSSMYTSTFGDLAGSWVYLVGAIAVLFSTFFVATASNGRVFADAVQVLGATRYRDEHARLRSVRILCVAIPLFCWVVAISVGQPVTLIFVGAIAQAALLPFLALAALHLRNRRVPRALAPRSATDAFLWLALASTFAICAYQLYDKLLA